MQRLVNVRRAGLHQVKVQQPILIVIDPAQTRAHGFQVILLLGGGRILLPTNACLLSNVSESNRDGDRWGRRGAREDAGHGGNGSRCQSDQQKKLQTDNLALVL